MLEKSPLVFVMSLLEDDLLLVEVDRTVFVDDRGDRETDGDVIMSGATSSSKA